MVLYMFAFQIVLAMAIPSLATRGDYLYQFLSEIFGMIFGVAVIYLFGYKKIFKEKRIGFGKGLIVAGYLVVIAVYTLIVQFVVSMKSDLSPVFSIIIFILCMVSIGVTEEFAFRGVVANLIFDKYGKDRAGVWFSVILSGVVFGFMHFSNAVGGVIAFKGVLVQVISAAFLGMLLTAIYFRTRNIWLLVFLHAFVDFASLIGTGIFTNGTLQGTISGYSMIQVFSVIPYTIVILVLLRKKKVQEIMGDVDMTSSKGSRTRLGITVAIIAVIVLICLCAGMAEAVQMGMEAAEQAM